jgi:hypothetical protein
VRPCGSATRGTERGTDVDAAVAVPEEPVCPLSLWLGCGGWAAWVPGMSSRSPGLGLWRRTHVWNIMREVVREVVVFLCLGKVARLPRLVVRVARGLIHGRLTSRRNASKPELPANA